MTCAKPHRKPKPQIVMIPEPVLSATIATHLSHLQSQTNTGSNSSSVTYWLRDPEEQLLVFEPSCRDDDETFFSKL